MVRLGVVRPLDLDGNDRADAAADLGRRRVDGQVIDARRLFARACHVWCPIVLELHRCFIAVARAVVDNDGRGGTGPDPVVWCAGGLLKILVGRGLSVVMLKSLGQTICAVTPEDVSSWLVVLVLSIEPLS